MTLQSAGNGLWCDKEETQNFSTQKPRHTLYKQETEAQMHLEFYVS